MSHRCQCLTIAGILLAVDSQICKYHVEENAPSVESIIVPSKSERRPWRERTCGGAEKEPCLDMSTDGGMNQVKQDNRKKERCIF